MGAIHGSAGRIGIPSAASNTVLIICNRTMIGGIAEFPCVPFHGSRPDPAAYFHMVDFCSFGRAANFKNFVTQCRTTVPPLLCRLDNEKKIGVARLLPASREHGVNLTAMMGLVVEKMRHEKPTRCSHLALQHIAEPDRVLV